MLPLLETVIAFAVIMLILSFLVKSLSSVLKNYEFFGSLLTGILASIGAPYWHDLLRAVAQFRKP